MKQITVFLFCFVFISNLRAQDAAATIEELITEIFEQYTAESEESIDYETFYDDLLGYADNPVNLNAATKEQLLRLAFLSDSQIESILHYVYKNGALKTIYELQLVDGLDMTDIRRMLPFVVAGEDKINHKKIFFQDLIKYGKNELFVRLDRGVETKEGYKFFPEEELDTLGNRTANYHGSQFYHSLKYRYHYKNRVLAGLTCEKDAGEQFWGDVNKGYDFYSAYVQLNDFGKFKNIVLGDFRANFGQGLVLRPEFGMGKSSYVLNVTPRNSGLKKYSSTDEFNFFRGVGATICLGKWDISAFFSNKNIDGDTLNNSFSSIYNTGAHRTDSELNKKHTVNQTIFGANSTLTFSNYQFGFTVVHTVFDKQLIPDKSAYNYFYFSGIRQTTGGINYRVRWHKLNLFGETSMTQNCSTATINGFNFSPVSTINLVALYRYYSPAYDTFYATAFSESSRISNESGFYMGAEIRPFRKWKIAAYADSYKFMWPKFGVDAPSVGTDYLVQTDYSAHRNLSMFWRFKYEEKAKNLSQSTHTLPSISASRKLSFRYNLRYSFENVSFNNLFETNLAQDNYAAMTYGFIASQDMSYRFISIPLKLDVRIQFFDALEYENRFYSYEKDILHAFSIPMYYGIGSRYYCNIRYDLNDKLSFWFKLAQTVYADERETVSSGNEELIGNRKTDIRFLLKYSF